MKAKFLALSKVRKALVFSVLAVIGLSAIGAASPKLKPQPVTLTHSVQSQTAQPAASDKPVVTTQTTTETKVIPSAKSVSKDNNMIAE